MNHISPRYASPQDAKDADERAKAQNLYDAIKEAARKSWGDDVGEVYAAEDLMAIDIPRRAEEEPFR